MCRCAQPTSGRRGSFPEARRGARPARRDARPLQCGRRHIYAQPFVSFLTPTVCRALAAAAAPEDGEAPRLAYGSLSLSRRSFRRCAAGATGVRTTVCPSCAWMPSAPASPSVQPLGERWPTPPDHGTVQSHVGEGAHPGESPHFRACRQVLRASRQVSGRVATLLGESPGSSGESPDIDEVAPASGRTAGQGTTAQPRELVPASWPRRSPT